MTGIVDLIDDTLDDWRGSADSARWRPEPTPEEVAAAIRLYGEAFKVVQRHVVVTFRQITEAWAGLKPFVDLMSEPPPKTLNAAYHRRLRNRVKRKNHRRR